MLKEHEGHDVIVCSEKCFRIYRTYVYPRYGHRSSVTGPAATAATAAPDDR